VVLARIRAGDRRAFEDLVRETWDDLVDHLTWILSSREAAEDACQEAFVRIWEKRERWHEGSARGLAFRIARNLAFDTKRRERIRRDRATREAEAIQRPEGADVLAESSEIEARVRQALATLAPGRREVIELVRLRGLTHQEVAEALGISPQTVANRMTLALADLRRLLADLLPGLAVSRPSGSREEGDHG
jgi:RNA polymerase sigma-19 factor, ECF subfamily